MTTCQPAAHQPRYHLQCIVFDATLVTQKFNHINIISESVFAFDEFQLQPGTRSLVDVNNTDSISSALIGSTQTFDRDAIFEEDDEDMTDEIDDDIEHLRPSTFEHGESNVFSKN